METIAPNTRPLPKGHRFSEDGGGYRVYGVPVFADHSRPVKDSQGNQRELRYTKQDLERIAGVMNFRAQNDNFQQAVHGDHTDLPGRHKRLAFATNYRVEPYVFEGGPRWVIVADWIARDRKALLALEDFPYRSVEVSPATGEFSSLAVMESQGPYFKFPLFRLEGVPDEWRAEYEAERAQLNYSDEELVLYREETEDAMQGMNQPEQQQVPYAGAQPPQAPPSAPQGGGNFVTREEFMSAMQEIMSAIKGMGQSQPPIQPVVNHSDLSDSQRQHVEAMIDGALTPYRDAVSRFEATQETVDVLAQRTELQDLLHSAHAKTAHVSRPHDFDEQIIQRYNDGGVSLANTWLDGLLINSPPSSVALQAQSEEVPSESNLPEALVPYRDNPRTFRAARELHEEYQSFPGFMKRGLSVEDHIKTNIGSMVG